jgi:superfamily II DNA/RNA helicase
MREETQFCNRYELEQIAPYLPTKAMRDAFKNARSVVKYVNLKIQGEALGRVLGTKRVACHVDMINHIGLEKLVQQSIKKTLIFTSYVEVVDRIADYFKKRDYPVLTAHGKTGELVKTTVDRFQTDFNANPLVATFKSLSTAVPLIEANTVVNINAPFRHYEYEQAISRVDRLGQDTPVEIINVHLDTDDRPNISTRSKDILEWSKEQVAILMGFPVEFNPETDDEMTLVNAELHSSTEQMVVPFSQQW